MAMPMMSRFRGRPYAFVLASLTALAMFFISETSYQQASAALNDLDSAGNARGDIRQLWRRLAEAEASQRGYLLTGRKEYLQPYNDSLGTMNALMKGLARYYASDPVGAPLLRQIDTLVRQKLSELATTISLHDDGKEEAWRELILTDIGKEKMEQVNALMDQAQSLETAKVATGRASIYQTLLLSRIGVSAMTALSLLALFMYLRQTQALLKQREALALAVRAERDRLEDEVMRRTTQLTELAQHLQTVREDERNRLARELHDELGALMTAAKLDVARLKSRLGSVSPEATERLLHLNESLNRGIALKRRIVEDLRPSSLSNLGLVPALEILLREFDARVDMTVASALEPVRLTPSGDLTVYRLVQEGLTNVVKYAKASRIDVRLGARDGMAHVSVQDDGVGFDPATPSNAAHGLLGMRYRVKAEGGTMGLVSAPGQGTRIEARLPEMPLAAPVEGPTMAVSGFLR